MYVCMYVCMYVYVSFYVCMYVCMHSCMYVCTIPFPSSAPNLPATILNHRADRTVVPIARRYCNASSRSCDGRRRRLRRGCLSLERATHQLDSFFMSLPPSLLQAIIRLVFIAIGDRFARFFSIISISIAAAIDANPIIAQIVAGM